MAVRGVIYNDQRGGYIDNVPATFTRKNTDIGIHYALLPGRRCAARTACRAPAASVPPGSPVINNGPRGRQQHQPGHLPGQRVEVLYKFNEDWDVLITQTLPEHGRAGRVLPAAQRLRWRSRCSRCR